MPRRPGVVRVEARAKLNLGLAVGPRRPDGFHEIATIFQSISLSDTLEARPRRRGFRLEVRDVETRVRGLAGRVPRGEKNLVLRAARLFAKRTGIRAGASFRLVKRIPAGSGMGGASVDAAATIAALARLNGVRVDSASGLEWALELGSDVPFAFFGGTALGLGRGEKLTRLRLSAPFRAVVAIPRWRVSTADAYRRIDRAKYGLTGWATKLRFAQSLETDEVTALQAVRLGNTFERVLSEWQADFQSLRERLRTAGLEHLRMTGSGSAVFGILERGQSAKSVTGRFEGEERLHVVGSTRSSLRFMPLPRGRAVG